MQFQLYNIDQKSDTEVFLYGKPYQDDYIPLQPIRVTNIISPVYFLPSDGNKSNLISDLKKFTSEIKFIEEVDRINIFHKSVDKNLKLLKVYFNKIVSFEDFESDYCELILSEFGNPIENLIISKQLRGPCLIEIKDDESEKSVKNTKNKIRTVDYSDVKYLRTCKFKELKTCSIAFQYNGNVITKFAYFDGKTVYKAEIGPTNKSSDITNRIFNTSKYWQYTWGWSFYSGSPDSDALLLQVAGNPCPFTWTDWASAAADLRQQISDYIGTSGTNIELCVTENNSDAGSMGRQSTSLVNALYLADSTSQLMKTEFRSYIWWDLHNGADPSGDFDPTIYGWRSNGDYGILSGSNTPYPTFYAEKLLQYFARPGDSVLNGTSDSLLLSAYAVHRTNGALTMLVINKDMTTSLNAQIALTNFAPWTNATIQSYGIPQDQAAETGAGASLQDIATTNFPAAGTNFSCSFPPLSLTLLTFAPGPSVLSVLGVPPGQVELLLRGQPGTPYVIQSSPDLMAWTSVSTNTLVGSTLSVTIPVSPGSPHQFYRAVWQP